MALVMKDAAEVQDRQNQKNNTYLSKRYADFYRLMLQPDGTTKVLEPAATANNGSPPPGKAISQIPPYTQV